jgi:hypothetical protein
MGIPDLKNEVICNPRVFVVNHTEEHRVEIKKILKENNIFLISCPENADASVTVDWILEKRPQIELREMNFSALEERVLLMHDYGFCGHPIANIGESITNCKDTIQHNNRQHWRGGKRGRKGKIKYERR